MLQEEKKPRPRKAVRKARRATPVRHHDHLHRWCMGYVGLAAVMSMGLNAWANGQHAPTGTQWAAWCMGGAIPVLVLLLGKIAGLCHQRRAGWLCGSAASVGIAVLGLSVFHCYESIHLLTGSGAILSVLLALGIDAGMVVAEAVSVVLAEPTTVHP